LNILIRESLVFDQIIGVFFSTPPHWREKEERNGAKSSTEMNTPL